MRNRAKCKLCNSIIESFHPSDYVICKCGEISVDGGEAFKCAAKEWSNFLRVDDEGNEIIVTISNDKAETEYVSNLSKPKKEDLVKMLDDMIANIENLPPKGLESSVNHYDLLSCLLLLSSIFKAED